MDTWAVWYGSMELHSRGTDHQCRMVDREGLCMDASHKLTSFVPGSIRMNG